MLYRPITRLPDRRTSRPQDLRTRAECEVPTCYIGIAKEPGCRAGKATAGPFHSHPVSF